MTVCSLIKRQTGGLSAGASSFITLPLFRFPLDRMFTARLSLPLSTAIIMSQGRVILSFRCKISGAIKVRVITCKRLHLLCVCVCKAIIKAHAAAVSFPDEGKRTPSKRERERERESKQSEICSRVDGRIVFQDYETRKCKRLKKKRGCSSLCVLHTCVSAPLFRSIF